MARYFDTSNESQIPQIVLIREYKTELSINITFCFCWEMDFDKNF